jgi:hypothetical protein
MRTKLVKKVARIVHSSKHLGAIKLPMDIGEGVTLPSDTLKLMADDVTKRLAARYDDCLSLGFSPLGDWMWVYATPVNETLDTLDEVVGKEERRKLMQYQQEELKTCNPVIQHRDLIRLEGI